MRALAVGLAAAFLVTSPAKTAETPPPLSHLPALRGDYFPLRSQATGTTYHIFVRLPEGYAADPARRYPVVYLLDGDSLFPLLATQHLFLTYDDKLPEAIVVGIAYGGFDPAVNKRDRDFGTGSASFSRFLEAELLPHVERSFRADSTDRTLVGQSFGGGYVLYSAFSEPDLFRRRIASNPSFRFHGELLKGPPKRGSRSNGQLAIVSGTMDRPPNRAAALGWFRSMEGKTAPWTWKRFDISGGTHAANMPEAYRAAMHWFFTTAP